MNENIDLFKKEDLDSVKISRIDNNEINLTNNDIEENNENVFNAKVADEIEDDDISDSEPLNSYDNLSQDSINRKIIIYNIKDHIMMFFLLFSSSMNFNILYIPSVLTGLYYIFLLFNNNKDHKRKKLKIEIIFLIYSVLLIIIKLIIFGLIENGHLDSETNISILFNFGIRYKKEDKHIFNIILTFIGEGTIIISCTYSIFISVIYRNVEMENNNNEITKGKLFSKIKFIIYICYILLLVYGVYNRSYLTLIYLVFYQILLIIITYKNNFPFIFLIFKIIRIFFLSVLSLQLFLINFFNINYFQEGIAKLEYIYKDEEKTEIKKVYSVFTMIGIYSSFYYSLLPFIFEWISYLFCVGIIILLGSSKNIIIDYNELLKHKNKLSEKNEIEENNQKSIVNKIKIFFIHFFTHQDFIIHLIRVLSVLWIYKLKNFYSIGIYIYLFCSFVFNIISRSRILIISLLIPINILSFCSLHISNINGYFENLEITESERYLHFCLEKDEGNAKYCLVGIYYLFVILFLNSFTDYNSNSNVKINLIKKNSLLNANENVDYASSTNDIKLPLLTSIIENNENEKKKNINKNIDDNINNDKSKAKEKIVQDIFLSDVILKYIYKNVNIITLVVMYFISMHTVNLIHFIFIIIFMIQILQAKLVERFSKIIIIIIQVLFLFEYIIDLTKIYYNKLFEEQINTFKFLLSISELENSQKHEINIYVEIYCYVAIYAFYIQNQLINSIKYQELENNEKISLKNYINFKFQNKLIKYVLFLIFNVIIEISIWIIFSFFFLICCHFEISLLYGIKLGIFLVVVYNFLKKSQIIEKNINISLKFNSFLIGYCCFNSFIVYGYQLICSDVFPIFNYLKETDNIILKNFPSIGLINYENKELLYKLLPHFLSNFLSILIYYELKSIYDRIDYNNKKSNINKNIDLNFIDDIINSEDNNILTNNNKENNDDTLALNIIVNDNIDENKEKEEMKEVFEINTDSNKEDKNGIINEEENKEVKTDNEINTTEKNIIEEKDEGNNDYENNNDIESKKKDPKIVDVEKIGINIDEEENIYNLKYIEIQNKIKSLNKKYIFYLLILFIFSLYHPSIFLIICYIFTFHNLSFSIIIYLTIYGISIILMFINILRKTSNYNYNYHHTFLFTQLIRYKYVEKKKHKEISNKYKYISFKLISAFSFIFLYLNYSYSIFYQLQDCNNNKIENNTCSSNTTIIEEIPYGNFTKSSAYLLGVYNYSNVRHILDSSGVYIFFFFLICISIYIQKLELKFDNQRIKNRKNYYDINQRKRHLKCILYIFKNLNKKNEKNNYKENLQILEELIKNYKTIENKTFNKFNVDKNFEKNFTNIFIKAKKLKVLLPEKSTKRKIIIFLRIYKRFIEYLIIFVLMCGVIIKVNVWSLVYMFIVIYLLMTKKSINKINYLFIFIIISIIIQSIIFLSNLNENINPKNDKEILAIINDTLNIPWYNFSNNNTIKHSVVLGLGLNKTQLMLLWIEYSLIFFIYIYLNYFCYTIFNNKYMELKEWKKQQNKSLIYKFIFNTELREALSKLNKSTYNKILNCMEYNFDVKLPQFTDIKQSLDIYFKSNSSTNKDIFSRRKEKVFKVDLFDYILYLSSHNIILIIITIITMMIYGFISVIYICFCLYFLFKSKYINLGKEYYYPFIIKSLLRPMIIADISFQLIIQIVYIYSSDLNNSDLFKAISNGFGLIKIIDDNYELTYNIFLLLGKCLCFFMMCIQKVIYSSREFNEFYLSYLIIKNEKFVITSLINTFRFNNERIDIMNKSMSLKKDMEDLMKNLQKDLKEWNTKLLSNNNNYIMNGNNNLIKMNENPIDKENNNQNENIINPDNNFNNQINILNIENNNSDNNLIDIGNAINILNKDNKIADESIVRNVVKNWILGQTFLIRIHLYLNRISFCYRLALDKKEGDQFMLNTIQGKNEYTPLIERKIDKEISKLVLSSFKNNEIRTLKKYLKRLNKINSYDFSKIIFFLKNENKIKKEKEKKFDEKFKELVKQDNYNQFSKIKNSKLFQKYLKRSFLFKKILIDIETIISNNFNWVCYFVMIFNHMYNASIISLFYPLSIFCFALLEYPRPSRKYWNICLIYTFIFLIIKSFSQRQFIGAFLNINKGESENYYEKLSQFLIQYPIGIKLFDSDNIKEYIINLIIDFLVIIVLIINMHILIINGLWENTEKYIENIYQGLKRVSIYKEESFEDDKEIKEFNKKYLSDKIKTHHYIKRKTTMANAEVKESNLSKHHSKDKLFEETKNYFQKLFPRIRNEKPGKDFYYIYSLIMVLLIFYVLFFYTSMVQDKTYGAVNISTNQFSGMSIILVLIHMLILIYDRVIYLRQNRYSLIFDYIFYDKNQKKFIDGENNEVKEKLKKIHPDIDIDKIPLEYMSELSKDYNVIIFQNETFNIPLFEKYILYMLLTILSHIFIFFFITMTGNYNLNNAFYCIREQPTDECNDFLENKTTTVFYLFYLIYLIFSGLQIKYGFYDLKRKSIFKNIYSIQGYIYYAYKLIPFYYQIKNVVDWTFTPTSLNLFDWFKFENLYDIIFKTYRQKYRIEKRPIGKRITKIFKILTGGMISIILVLILIIPLFLYSSLNPTNEINNINSAQLKVYLSFIDINLQEKNYLIFENDWAEGINKMPNKIWEDFGYSKSFYTKTFPQEQIQIASFYTEPENSLSDFKLSHIITSIESLLYQSSSPNATISDENVKCNLVIEAIFKRPLPNEAKTVTKKSELVICDLKDIKSSGCNGLNQTYMLFNNSDSHYIDNNVTINIPGFSPYVRLTASAEPKSIELEKQINRAIILKPIYKNRAYLFEIYFENIKDGLGLQYHLFNDKVSSSTLGYSILGFYSAFILVIGTYVTNIFNYNPERIIIGEMPHPEKLLNLCECVKISRYTYDFKKEEYLYSILIEIMRTPDFIKKLTQSTVEQFQRRMSLPS